jgi:hypothetical protein
VGSVTLAGGDLSSSFFMGSCFAAEKSSRTSRGSGTRQVSI